VALDVAAIANLQRLGREDDREVEEWLERWRATGVRLVLTPVHLVELFQGGSPENVEELSRLFQRFGAVDFLDLRPDRMIELEAECELRSALFGENSERNRLRAINVAIAHLDDPQIADLCTRAQQQATEPWVQSNLSRFAAALDLKRQLLQELRPMAKKGVKHPDGETVGQKMRAARSTLISDLDLGELRLALAAPLEDLPWLGEMFNHVAPILKRNYAQFGPMRVKVLLADLDFYKMPGGSLWVAATRGQLLGSETIYKNSVQDASHLIYAPYVDLLFCDPRTHAHYVAQYRSAEQATRASFGHTDVIVSHPNLGSVLDAVELAVQSGPRRPSR
jgi:hypothetical protein